MPIQHLLHPGFDATLLSNDTSTAIPENEDCAPSSRSPPDASRAPFPHRSPRRSSANAACGGLPPPSAGRLRRATPSSPAQHHVKNFSQDDGRLVCLTNRCNSYVIAFDTLVANGSDAHLDVQRSVVAWLGMTRGYSPATILILTAGPSTKRLSSVKPSRRYSSYARRLTSSTLRTNGLPSAAARSRTVRISRLPKPWPRWLGKSSMSRRKISSSP